MALQVPQEEVKEAINLYNEIKDKCDGANKQIQQLIKRVEDEELSTSKGLSFLEVKYQLLLSYLVNLTFLMCRKSRGQSICGNTTVGRLVEIRTVLEKIRPIDQKLKYQIDKLIKTATTGIAEHDPLRYKPNPDNLISKLDVEDDGGSGSESEEESSAPKKYRPPKLAAVHYEGDETEEEKIRRKEERRMKRILSSSIMKELQSEYDEGPEEVKDNYDMHRDREDKARKEREEYEETYMLRMQLSKKEKAASRKMSTMSSLSDITRFGDVRGMFDESHDGGPSRKKRKVPGISKKGKKKSKGFKKRR